MITLGTMAGTAYLYVVIPKGFFPVEDTGFISVDRRGAGRHLVPRDAGPAEADRRHHPARPGGRLRQFDGRRRRPERDQQHRPHVRRLEAEGGARTVGRRCCSGCAATTNKVVGMAVYFREIQNINLGGRIAKGEFQYTMQSSETETLYRMSDEMLDEDQDDRRVCATSTAISTSRTRRSRSRSTARRRRSTASRSIRSARSSTTRSAPGRSRRSTRRSTTIRSSWRRGPNSRPTPPACRRSISRPTLPIRPAQ